MSDSISPHVEHRRQWMEFATRHSDLRYREPLADLYRHARAFIAEELGGRQSLPFIGFAGTPPRGLCCLSEHTGHGARWAITLNAGLAVDVNLAWVINPLPSSRTRRFVHGLLERMLVCQFVREVDGSGEE